MTTKETNNKRGIFLRLSRYVLEQWPLFLLALALTLGSNQLSLLGPRYSGAAIDAIELAGGVDFPAVWDICPTLCCRKIVPIILRQNFPKPRAPPSRCFSATVPVTKS